MAPKMSLENFSIRSQIFEAAKWQPGSSGWPECAFYDVNMTIFKENVKKHWKNGGGPQHRTPSYLLSWTHAALPGVRDKV